MRFSRAGSVRRCGSNARYAFPSMARTVLYRFVAYLRIAFLRPRRRTRSLRRTQHGAAHGLALAIRALAVAIAALPPFNASEAQTLWMKRFLPSCHNVGILFVPARNERRAAEDAAPLVRDGCAPVVAPATGPTALPNALTRFTNSVDVLHALPDTTPFAREHSRVLLLFSLCNPHSARRTFRMSAAGEAKARTARRRAIERGRHAGHCPVVR
jgi:hypothetical protein